MYAKLTNSSKLLSNSEKLDVIFRHFLKTEFGNPKLKETLYANISSPNF